MKKLLMAALALCAGLTQAHIYPTKPIRCVVPYPAINDRLQAQGVEPVANTPAEFAEFIKSEIARWARVAQLARIKAE